MSNLLYQVNITFTEVELLDLLACFKCLKGDVICSELYDKYSERFFEALSRVDDYRRDELPEEGGCVVL